MSVKYHSKYLDILKINRTGGRCSNPKFIFFLPHMETFSIFIYYEAGDSSIALETKQIACHLQLLQFIPSINLQHFCFINIQVLIMFTWISIYLMSCKLLKNPSHSMANCWNFTPHWSQQVQNFKVNVPTLLDEL